MIGDITPKFSAVVKLTSNLVSIEFAREVDADVLADLANLKNHPAIETWINNIFWIKESYDPKVVAEAISKSLTENHGFGVRRMLNGSTGYKDVYCFTGS